MVPVPQVPDRLQLCGVWQHLAIDDEEGLELSEYLQVFWAWTGLADPAARWQKTKIRIKIKQKKYDSHLQSENHRQREAEEVWLFFAPVLTAKH